VLLDLPLYARMYSRCDFAANVSVTLLLLSSHEVLRPEARREHVATYLQPDQGQIFAQPTSSPWILRCRHFDPHISTELTERAEIPTDCLLQCLDESRVLPYEVSPMSPTQWTSLRDGAPRISVCRTASVLACNLLLTASEYTSKSPARPSTLPRWLRAAKAPKRQKRRELSNLMRLLPSALRSMHQRRTF
jgi:hypothetical protein